MLSKIRRQGERLPVVILTARDSVPDRVKGLDHGADDYLPAEVAITSITMAELAAGPHATADAAERARRQDRLQRTEAAFDPLPFDGAAARAYGRVYAAVAAQGREARGAREVDLLIAAVAVAADLPLCTRKPDDFAGLDGLVDVVAV